MSQFNTDQFAYLTTSPITENRPDEYGGRKRTLYAKYTTDATTGLLAADVVVIGKLPAGARVTSCEVIVPASFLTASVKIGYGSLSGTTYTATDDDRWAVALDLSAVGRKQGLIVAADMDYRTTAEVAVAMTVVTTTSGLAKQMAFLIEYVVD